MKDEKDNRIKLKIRKKSINAQAKSKFLADSPSLDVNVASVQKKRSNPFSRENVKKVHLQDEQGHEEEKSKLLRKLDSVGSTDDYLLPQIDVDICPTEENVSIVSNDVPENDENMSEKKKTWKYTNSNFPLDWGIKQKIQLISKDPLTFCSNLKSRDKAVGIKMFANNDETSPQFYKHLCTWLYPFIPGIRNFPLRKSAADKLALPGAKDIVSSSDHIDISKPLQMALLQQWTISFQSLFNMLKSNFCPYFYVCSYQFSALFKAANLCNGSIKVILTPTTKGFRTMLTEEDIPFQFAYKDEDDAMSSSIDHEEKSKMSSSDDVDYDADVFLNSLGLNKEEQFPDIEELRKHSVRTELKRLDNRPESTIEISDGQAFLNFLLNSSMLCATSGSLKGIPPTLLSPVLFEEASCHVNKYSIGKIKQASGECLHCLDIYGSVLPTNLKGIVDLMQMQSSEFQVRTKGYENLFAFNAKTSEEKVCEQDDDSYLKQEAFCIPEQNEIQFVDKLFKC